jgi:signal transduction histidine kinase
VTFKDNGPGIDSKDSPNIFEPFYTTKSKGTGLGLSICKRLTERLGGELKYIEAQNPEETGATFQLTLPLK